MSTRATICHCRAQSRVPLSVDLSRHTNDGVLQDVALQGRAKSRLENSRVGPPRMVRHHMRACSHVLGMAKIDAMLCWTCSSPGGERSPTLFKGPNETRIEDHSPRTNRRLRYDDAALPPSLSYPGLPPRFAVALFHMNPSFTATMLKIATSYKYIASASSPRAKRK